MGQRGEVEYWAGHFLGDSFSRDTFHGRCLLYTGVLCEPETANWAVSFYTEEWQTLGHCRRGEMLEVL